MWLPMSSTGRAGRFSMLRPGRLAAKVRIRHFTMGSLRVGTKKSLARRFHRCCTNETDGQCPAPQETPCSYLSGPGGQKLHTGIVIHSSSGGQVKR